MARRGPARFRGATVCVVLVVSVCCAACSGRSDAYGTDTRDPREWAGVYHGSGAVRIQRDAYVETLPDVPVAFEIRQRNEDTVDVDFLWGQSIVRLKAPVLSNDSLESKAGDDTTRFDLRLGRSRDAIEGTCLWWYHEQGRGWVLVRSMRFSATRS